MRLPILCILLLSLAFIGCSTKDNTLAPASSSLTAVTGAAQAGRADPGQPGYEPAYVNGETVTINAIEVPNHAPYKAQADLYETVYPIGWQSLGLAAPQCNPCDHQHNGIDFTDFHNHVLDSMPGTGHGEFKPLWHVWLVIPAYNGDPTHDAMVSAQYATFMPATSEDAVNELLATSFSGGGPLAVKIDTDFYFICAVVGGPHPQP